MTDSLSTIRHLIDQLEAHRPGQPAEFYRSSDGDIWELVRPSAEEQHCMVLHTPAPASGGEPSLVTIGTFLAVHSCGPEHEALRILLPGTGSKAADR